jgi:hypothetical protein
MKNKKNIFKKQKCKVYSLQYSIKPLLTLIKHYKKSVNNGLQLVYTFLKNTNYEFNK